VDSLVVDVNAKSKVVMAGRAPLELLGGSSEALEIDCLRQPLCLAPFVPSNTTTAMS
jgi:hypothetical protein